MPQGKKFVKRAYELADQNPEMFDALMEFEKTKKLPRFTHKKRANFTISDDILKQFRRYCEENGMKMSAKLEQLMLNIIRSNKN